MKFSEFDKQMRVYENFLDQTIEPGTYFVARLDGRGFTKLTKREGYNKPFDINFRDLMLETTRTLMLSGFEVIYGYTQSDEISLLFKKNTDIFNRKVRKYDSVLAGVASGSFSLRAGYLSTFDCRMIPLPNLETVIDYFKWRQEDAGRNALNGHCYWLLRKEGKSGKAADSILKSTDYKFKVGFLREHGIDYNTVPLWQKRGIGVWFGSTERVSTNQLTGEDTTVERRVIVENACLPTGDDYGALITDIIDKSSEHLQDTEEMQVI